MNNITHTDGNPITEENKNSNYLAIDLGVKSLHKWRFSRSVIIPAIALRNCGPIKANMVHVILVQEKGQKYIRIDPIYKSKEVFKN